jgi:predicted ATPase
VETLREAIKMLYREQLLMVVPAASRALADALARSGSYSEARVTIDTAVSSARKMAQKFWLPELLRTQGEIMLCGPSPDFDAAEPAFRESFELARDQSAIAWELKAAVPLARLLLQQGRVADVRALVGPIYEAHSEKSGTKDLVEAAAILTALQRSPDPRN